MSRGLIYNHPVATISYIRPRSKYLFFNLKEVWNFKELFLIFSWRDIKVRYKQTLIGLAWVIFQPLLTSTIFTIFFGNLAKIPSGELPYSLFVLTGMIFWSYFSTGLTHASNSMIENEHIIKKVYFPKAILPISGVVTSSVDFLVNLMLWLIIATVMKFGFNPLAILIIPLNILITFSTAAGIGMFLAAVNVKFRDVRYILPFFIQTLMFLTPIIYPTTIVRPSYRFIMALNPMSSVIESSRQLLTAQPHINWLYYLISIISMLVIVFAGLAYFRQTEKYFADIV